MKRTTIFLPEALERDLYVYAKRSGKPASSVVREAIAAYISDDHAQALPSFAAAFDSGHTDTAERHDDLLFKTLEPHADDVVPARVRPSPRTGDARRKPQKPQKSKKS